MERTKLIITYIKKFDKYKKYSKVSMSKYDKINRDGR